MAKNYRQIEQDLDIAMELAKALAYETNADTIARLKSSVQGITSVAAQQVKINMAKTQTNAMYNTGRISKEIHQEVCGDMQNIDAEKAAIETQTILQLEG